MHHNQSGGNSTQELCRRADFRQPRGTQVSTFAIAPEAIFSSTLPRTSDAVASHVAKEARSGLTASPKTLSPWLFYDEAGSALFEQITELPEYYPTRTERSIFALHAPQILREAATTVHKAAPATRNGTHASNRTHATNGTHVTSNGNDPSNGTHATSNGISSSNGTAAPMLTLIELGAGTATKTGILLAEAVRQQGSVVYQPVDVSETALAAARENILANLPGVTVRVQVADYTREPLPLDRLPNTRTLALYIGSSIGNFTPEDARDVLRNLRAQLLPGDALLLGTDLRPSGEPTAHKTEATLLAAYDDAAGTTAAFNLNVLTRLNRDLGADFHTEAFRHKVFWNPIESRIEMHLESLIAQRVHIPANAAGPALTLEFAPGETIHTENSYKFTPTTVAALLTAASFTATNSWQDPHHLFAVTLATAV
jgi:L-histidine Nalpha-methyltransferase